MPSPMPPELKPRSRSATRAEIAEGKHAIGGNDDFFARHASSGGSALRKAETSKMPAEHNQRIAEDSAVQETQAAMPSRSEAMFGRS